MPKSPTPVSSFGPEILQALVRGATGRIELKAGMTYRTATMFRQRAHKLRNRMREEGHPEAAAVARTRIQVLWGKEAGFDPVPEKRNAKNVRFPVNIDCPAIVVLSPQDSEFDAALKEAGIEVKPLDGSDFDLFPSLPSEAASPDPDDPLADYAAPTHDDNK